MFDFAGDNAVVLASELVNVAVCYQIVEVIKLANDNKPMRGKKKLHSCRCGPVLAEAQPSGHRVPLGH